MSDNFSKVTCPFCGQHLEYPADTEATSVTCPDCSQPIPIAGKQVASATQGPPPPPASAAKTPQNSPARNAPVQHTTNWKPYLFALAIAVVGGFWLVHKIEDVGKPDKPRGYVPPAVKWQYVTFDPQDLEGRSSDEGMPVLEVIVDRGNWKWTNTCFSAPSMLNALGDEGFELVHFSPAIAILKRPDAGQPTPYIQKSLYVSRRKGP